MEFQDFLQCLSQTLNLPELANNDDFHASFTADGIPVHLDFISEYSALLLYCDLFDLPPTTDGKLIEKLLELNYLFEGTGGSTIGKQPGTNKLMLVDKITRFEYADWDHIIRTIESLVNSAERIINLLENYRSFLGEAPRSVQKESPSSNDVFARINA